MVTLDLAKLTVREVNQGLREAGEAGDHVTVLNPDARHHIGVGLTSAITVRVEGSAGYFCAGLSDQAHFEVTHNVGWGVGDNMYSGSVQVGGNAGAIPGVAIRGAEIVIQGNMGSRAGQVMKAGTLCCAGDANFMAGYMMYGGRIIILGDSGERVGEDMSAGEIFIGGKVQELGSDAMLSDTETSEIEDIRRFLDRYGIFFKGSSSNSTHSRKT